MIVPHLGWFDVMALPDVHMEPTVPTPAESVCGVYVLWLVASKKHNLILKKSCYAKLYHR